VEDPYHYIDIDRQTTAQPGDQSVPRGGYEGLDRAMLTARRQPAPPGEYAGLVTAAAAQPPVSGSTQPADQHSGSDGHIEMTDPAAGNDSPATVSQLIVQMPDSGRLLSSSERRFLTFKPYRQAHRAQCYRCVLSA